MKIGELAGETGTQVETIRYYERAGLLPSAARTSGNYRVYGPDHVARLAFIRHCRALGMALDEIRALLRFKDAPGEHCGEVNALLDEHIGHVRKRIRELRALERQLQVLRSSCGDVQAVAQCGILRGLDQSAPPVQSAATSPVSHMSGVHGRPRQARGNA